MFRKSFILFIIINTSIAYADKIQQTITSCVTVATNNTDRDFASSFISTDFFDSGSTSNKITNGKACAKHSYREGPKNLHFFLKLPCPCNKPLKINLDGSCLALGAYLEQNRGFPPRGFNVISPLVRAEASQITWDFFVSQETSDNDSTPLFNVSCELKTN